VNTDVEVRADALEQELMDLFCPEHGWHTRTSVCAVVYFLDGENFRQQEHIQLNPSKPFESSQEAADYLKRSLLEYRELHQEEKDKTIVWRSKPEIKQWKGHHDVWLAYARFSVIPCHPHSIFERCK
jgi:hypothetical protein